MDSNFVMCFSILHNIYDLFYFGQYRVGIKRVQREIKGLKLRVDFFGQQHGRFVFNLIERMKNRSALFVILRWRRAARYNRQDGQKKESRSKKNALFVCFLWRKFHHRIHCIFCINFRAKIRYNFHFLQQ